MVNEIQYTSIGRVLDDLTDHPMLSDLTLEQVVRHTIRFIALHGYPKLYQDKIEDVEIHEFRGLLPCDCISIVQVRDAKTGICLRAMTDTFGFRMGGQRGETPLRGHGEPAFKTQGRVIYTSFPEGMVEVAYKAIPVDEDGYPMLIDNEVYLGALEAYIKKQVFTVKFDTGKVAAGVLQNAQTDYAVLSHELKVEFTTPSLSEAEAMSRQYQTMILNMRSFDRGFRDLGDREYLKRH